MKTLATALISLICLVNASAQDGNDVFASSKRIEGDKVSSSSPVRREVVGPDFRPATSPSVILMRETRKTADGYEVKVKAADGSLRMQGTYSDAQLATANGLFSYYHDNGRLESEGQMVNGVKSGVWQRYDRDGNAMAERVYGGQTYEQMAFTYGWKARAGK